MKIPLKQDSLVSIAGFGGNVVICTAIVFCNKILMGKSGYGFHFATTLSALHFLAAGVTVFLTQGASKGSGRLPLRDLLFFTVVADASIICLNLSLLLNPVSTYQVAKLLVIPYVCLIERFFLGSTFSSSVVFSILLVVLGVGIVTVEEFSFDATPLGLAIAAGSVVASGSQQVLVRSLQQAHSLSSNELLGSVAPAQAASLLLLGPAVDKLVSGDWVSAYLWNVPAINAILLSCALAVGVNVTQFLCLGRFSAVSFQVLGHAKTILVLLGSWIFLGEHASPKKLLGMALAVLGMVLYGHFSMKPPAAAASGSARAPASPRSKGTGAATLWESKGTTPPRKGGAVEGKRPLSSPRERIVLLPVVPEDLVEEPASPAHAA